MDSLTPLQSGQQHLANGDVEQAARDFEQAVLQNPQSALELTLWGRALMILGATAKATEVFDRAMQIDPAQPGLSLSYARSRKFTAAPRPELEQLESLLTCPELAALLRADTHFALGKIYDDLDRFETAFEHFRQANETMKRSLVYDNSKVHRGVKELTETFTKRFFAKPHQTLLPDAKPIFIIGMPRSGTTLVEQIISSHDDVTPGDELPFMQDLSVEIASDLGAPYPRVARRITTETAAAYAGVYMTWVTRKLGAVTSFTDKMPTNYFHLGLIATLFPSATVVHCQRNPLSICLSNYCQQFAQGNEWSYDLAHTGQFYGHYHRLMSHWEAVLPLKIVNVSYENLVSDHEAESRRLMKECDLTWSAQCLRFFSTRRAVSTSSNWQVRQPIYSDSLDRWRHYDQFLAPLKHTLGNLAPVSN